MGKRRSAESPVDAQDTIRSNSLLRTFQ